MKKLIIFISLFFLFGGINQSFSTWYGGFVQNFGPGITWCPTDGDPTGGSPTFSPGNGFSNYTYDSFALHIFGGNIAHCLFWDASNPYISVSDSNTSWRAPFTLTLYVGDAGGSTLAEAKYSWNSAPDCLGGAGNSFSNGTSISVGPPYGSNTLYLCARDIAGNQYTTSYTYNIDNVAPEITASPNSTSRVNTNISVNLGCSDPQWTSCTDFRYVWTTSPTPPALGTYTSVSGTNPSITTTLTTDGIWYLHTYGRDTAMPSSTYTTFGPYRLDKTVPTTSDVSNTVNTNLLATNNSLYSFSVGVNGGSPITSISGVRERYNNENIDLPFSCSSSPCNVFWDIRNVYTNILSNGGREYTFRITQICDQAGNCWNGTQNYNHNVYANSTALVNDSTFTSSQKDITTNQLTGPNVADGTSKNLTISLRDKYGNIIIPASGINRTIDFNFNVTNTMFLNQHSRTGDKSVYVNRTTAPTTFLNTRLPGGATSLNGEFSTNGDYTYTFKVYTPTSNQDNIYGQVSDKDAVFTINNLTFDINGTIGAQSSQSLNSWTPIISKFNPLYHTNLTGEIIDNGFVEGATQNSSISIIKNGSTSTINNKLQLSYSGADSSKFNLYGGTNTSNASNVGGTNIATRSNIQSIIPTFPSITSFYTRLIQKPLTVGTTSKINLATHITYDITHPNGVGIISPVYNSFVLGKDSYHGTENGGEANQSGLKVLGQVSTSSGNQIIDNQFSNDVIIVGNINGFYSKTQIVKNGYLFAKNSSGNTSNGYTITNVDTNNNVDDVIYLGAESGHGDKVYKLGNGTSIPISENRTILVIGGNLYIKSNLYYTGNGMLGIVVLKDKDGKGGNVYIDPDVTNIVGTIFAEKSVIGYNGSNELDGSTQANILKNQLHIYGSLFSENTIGGSRNTTPKCPYFISSCTLETSQKYDLNYLRRYYLIQDGAYKKPANSAKAIGGGTYSSNGSLTGGNTSFARNITNTSNTYASYSVMIEYNPKIQLYPPPLFTIEK